MKLTPFSFPGIPYLTHILIFSQVIVYLFISFGNVPSDLFFLQGNSVLYQGEWYRLLTFLLSPAYRSNIIFQIISFFFYYFLGTRLAMFWGDKFFTFFIFTGYIITVISAFIFPSIVFDNRFLFISSMLAFGFFFGETRFLVYFIIPVKVRWLVYLYCFFDLLQVFNHFAHLFLILPGYLAFSIVVLLTKRKKITLKKRLEKRMVPSSPKPTHSCAECQANSQDFPKLNFRYCEHCGACLCENHLAEHSCSKK